MFKNLKIGRKLGLGFATVLLLLAFVSFYSYQSFNSTQDLTEHTGQAKENKTFMVEKEVDHLKWMAGLSDLVNLAGDATGNSEELSRRTEEKIARAQAKIRRAQKRAARKIAEAQRRAETRARRDEQRSRRSTRGKSFTIDLSDLKKSAKSTSEPVSDEERLMILNMVAENKITLEEAEALLSALEGK